MFETFRNAWRQAVDNFWQELQEDEAGPEGRARGMYDQVAAARNGLDRLDREISDCRREEKAERDEAQVCARRERMAREIADVQTARLAAEYRQRHEERAAVLARKLDVLVAERRLCQRDLDEMERALASVRAAAVTMELEDLNRHPREVEFQELERTRREREAAERLEELKRRSRS